MRVITSKEVDKKALTELSEVISHMERSLKDRIPEEVCDGIEKNKDKAYGFKYHKGVALMPETKALLSVLLSEYLCSDKNKEKWKDYDRNARFAMEVSRTRYDPSEIFKNNREEVDNTETPEQAEQALAVQKDNMFTRVISKIKNIFTKKY